MDVVAVHTESLVETAPDFIAEKYAESGIIFVRDLAGEAYALSLNIRGTYPATVVIDENGVIVERIVGSATYEQLETVVKKALEE